MMGAGKGGGAAERAVSSMRRGMAGRRGCILAGICALASQQAPNLTAHCVQYHANSSFIGDDSTFVYVATTVSASQTEDLAHPHPDPSSTRLRATYL
ncbi:hypothetical protein BDQ12DRAFT_725778 [Crucibulum laeve]|uniref:Uncharacterized protein n=1 Tax=Crucibulum laeve TaxID=68775 RepID=A0A5C3LUV4_9AGAR|nr:hypothetical protein BDQ12DRAFT_725778 [Crucibulum laeve]